MKIKKGFTLLEILIASTIFAVVMILTTAIVSQGGSYFSKLRAQKAVSEDTRRLADLVARDFREARGAMKIAYNDGAGDKTVDYKKGIGFFACDYDTSRCVPVYAKLSSEVSSANTIVLATADKLKVYWFVGNYARATYYYEFPISQLNQSTGQIDIGPFDHRSLNNIVNQSSLVLGGDAEKGLVSGSAASAVAYRDSGSAMNTREIKTALDFISFYCSNATANVVDQTFLMFNISSEVGLPSEITSYATTSIRTMVTSRDY